MHVHTYRGSTPRKKNRAEAIESYVRYAFKEIASSPECIGDALMPLLLVAEQLQGEYAHLYEYGEPSGMDEEGLRDVFRAVWAGTMTLGTQRGSNKG
jgi:hypothetical protein